MSQSFYLLEFLLALFKLIAGLKLQSEFLSEWTHASIAVSASPGQQRRDPALFILLLVFESPQDQPARKTFSRN